MIKREKRRGRFLRELDSFYKRRADHGHSVPDIPVPQNFIPGVNRGKVRAQSEPYYLKPHWKINTVCYKGALVKIRDEISVLEKGVLGAGLMALTVPSPSEHFDCLEHSSGKYFKDHDVDMNVQDNHIDQDETKQTDDHSYNIVHCEPVRKRSFSFPLVYSSDDYDLVWKLSHTGDDDSVESHEVLHTSSESHVDMPHYEDEVNSKTVESDSEYSVNLEDNRFAASLPELILSSEIKFDTNVSSAEKHCTIKKDKISLDTSVDITVTSEDNQDVEPRKLSSIPCSVEDNESRPRAMTDVSHAARKESDLSEPSMLAIKTTDRKISNCQVCEPDFDKISHKQMQALAQIQSVMRAKLPKTFQATVKMGLNLEAIGKGSTEHDINKISANNDKMKRNRSNTLGSIFGTTSMITSPFAALKERRGTLPSVFAKRKTCDTSTDLQQSSVSLVPSPDEENKNVRSQKAKSAEGSGTFPRVKSSSDSKRHHSIFNFFSHSMKTKKHPVNVVSDSIDKQLDAIAKQMMLITPGIDSTSSNDTTLGSDATIDTQKASNIPKLISPRQPEEKSYYGSSQEEKHFTTCQDQKGNSKFNTATGKQENDSSSEKTKSDLFTTTMSLLHVEQRSNIPESSSCCVPRVTSNTMIHIGRTRSTTTTPNYLSSKLHLPKCVQEKVGQNSQNGKTGLSRDINHPKMKSNELHPELDDYSPKRKRKVVAFGRTSPLLSELRKVKPQYQKGVNQVKSEMDDIVRNDNHLDQEESSTDYDSDIDIDSLNKRVKKLL